MAAVERPVFGELSSGRLQQLASAKNRQNGLISTKEAVKPTAVAPTPTKRSYAMSSLNDDSENVDPVLSFSSFKKNKFELFQTPSKPVTFGKTTPTLTEPRHVNPRLDTASNKTPLTAPAGRSPKRRSIGLAAPRRAFARVNPPFSTSASAGLPFSLDAALSSTLGPPKPAVKPLPAKWRFEIYQDSPDEEAGILMEHSTLTLDLSSDDEGTVERKSDRGKENVAPEGYDAPTASAHSTSTALSISSSGPVEIVRKKVETDEMDEGQRTPLSELEIEPFSSLEAGDLTVVIVDAEHTVTAQEAQVESQVTLAAATTSELGTKAERRDGVPAKSVEEIVIYEDDSAAAVTASA